jgi:hypothetical protein
VLVVGSDEHVVVCVDQLSATDGTGSSYAYVSTESSKFVPPEPNMRLPPQQVLAVAITAGNREYSTIKKSAKTGSKRTHI